MADASALALSRSSRGARSPQPAPHRRRRRSKTSKPRRPRRPSRARRAATHQRRRRRLARRLHAVRARRPAISPAPSSPSSRTARSSPSAATVTPTSTTKKPVDPKLTLFRPGSVSKLVHLDRGDAARRAGQARSRRRRQQLSRFPDSAARRQADHAAQHHDAHRPASRNRSSTSSPKIRTRPTTTTLLKRWTPTRVFDAGTTPAYSNYATSLAGYIVERVSGESFFDYIDKHIFAPLDMKHSTFRQPLPKDLEPLHVEGLHPGVGRAEEVRDRRPGAGRRAVVAGRGHGAFHDRAPAERRIQRQPHPQGGNREDDARQPAARCCRR